MRFVHIVNPVKVPSAHPLYASQRRMFESLRRSRAACEYAEIVHVSAQYREDRGFVPKFFLPTPDLKRSIIDLVPGEKKRRKLPLLRDIMARAMHIPADYYIYTNADIILQKHFYGFVQRKIFEGHDALIINRKRIPFSENKSLATLSKEAAERGKCHPGFDCFVLSRNVLHRLCLSNVCVGIPFIGVTMAHNLFAFARKVGYYEKQNLTFHLGTALGHKAPKKYYWHNRRMFFQRVKPVLWTKFKPYNFPYARCPLPERYLRWALNPSLFVWMNFKLELRTMLYGTPSQKEVRRPRPENTLITSYR